MNKQNTETIDIPKSPLHNSLGIKANYGVLLLENGDIFHGIGVGHEGVAGAELCFNTGLTGYQEILTDPSYSGQIVTFAFPHIGIVGTNDEDSESQADQTGANGAVFREVEFFESNYRADESLPKWLESKQIVGITGVDTRAIIGILRREGMQRAIIANCSSKPDIAELKSKLNNIPAMEGQNLAVQAATTPLHWQQPAWKWDDGYAHNDENNKTATTASDKFKIAVLDMGCKANILRLLTSQNCAVQTFKGDCSLEEILASNPDGIVISNGPGDPYALGDGIFENIRNLIATNIPIMGICIGHQLIALALGGKTKKMKQGHHGVNHPVLELSNRTVRITSMNHGFDVDADSLPDNVEITHKSLFDGSNCGLRLKDKPVFSVQFHPEASPGPQEGIDLFDKFIKEVKQHKSANTSVNTLS